MRKCITIIIFFLPLYLFIVSCNKHSGPLQNLVINGSAELPKYDSVPRGWVNVQGHWISPEEDSTHHDCAYAQNGRYIFFAGNDTLGILQQDVNVSNYAPEIDKHKQQFAFNGYVQSLDQGPNSDQAQIILTGLDSSKTKIINIFKTDSTRALSKWRLIADTFSVAPLTRFIRIQLKAIRHVGGANDGYFDNMILTALPVEGDLRIVLLIITAIIIFLALGFIIRSKRNRNK
ncbi:MAG: C-terminal target protein [Mucilaginibacter sp.]|nr:C-terminal target protein [Mucilaginibacter sp.]